MTPRQMAGWLELARRRKSGEQVTTITNLRAGQGDAKSVRKMLQKLADESA